MARLLAALALLLATAAVQSHPDDAWVHQAHTLAAWAQAVSHSDHEAIRGLTAIDAAPYPGSPDTTVVTRYATFSPTGQGGVTASPVVILIDGGTFTMAASVLLREEEEGWKVAAVTPSAEVPPAFQPANLPEHADSRPVRFSLSDADTGEPVYARVRITDTGGGYWPPNGHQKHIRTGWRQDVGGDVTVDGKTYAYVPPEFTAMLPDGDFTLEVRKGTEYLPGSVTFPVGGGDEPTVALAMQRWVDMEALGWHAGDTHTHFLDDATALLELRAEDLSLVYVLATKWGELITGVPGFTGAPSSVSGNGEVVVVNEESRHRWLGHTILHGIESLIYPLSWGGPSEGVTGGYDYPPMAHQADRAHAQGGLVTWAHFPYPGGELAVDVGLGKVDTVDLFTWNDAFAPGPTLPGGTALPSAAETWYLFLNTGARLPATAGTDKMLNVQVTGSVRTYANTGPQFSYTAWLDALKRGATMVTTGPVVTLAVNGQDIGSSIALAPGAPVDIEARLEAPYRLYPVDTLEIVMGGEVIASTANADGRSTLEASIRIEATDSTWVAARARGSELLPLQMWPAINTTGIPPMAHTSPIYLEVEGRPLWKADAARQLEARVDRAIQWARSEARFRSEAERQEVIELFERAKAHYAREPLRASEAGAGRD